MVLGLTISERRRIPGMNPPPNSVVILISHVISIKVWFVFNNTSRILFIRHCTTARNPDSSFHSCLTCRLPSVNKMSTFGSEAESQRSPPPNSLSSPMLHKLFHSLNVSPIARGGERKDTCSFLSTFFPYFANQPRPFFFPTPPSPLLLFFLLLLLLFLIKKEYLLSNTFLPFENLNIFVTDRLQKT